MVRINLCGEEGLTTWPSPHKILAVLAAFPLTFAYTILNVLLFQALCAHFFALATPALPRIYGMHCIMVCYNIACGFVGIELGCYLDRGPDPQFQIVFEVGPKLFLCCSLSV
jgi:hypothetical protein